MNSALHSVKFHQFHRILTLAQSSIISYNNIKGIHRADETRQRIEEDAMKQMTVELREGLPIEAQFTEIKEAWQGGHWRSLLIHIYSGVPDEATLVDGHYVLKGEEFSDEKKGWALVLARGERCSPQTIVTHCTLYQEYMTEDALQKAADSYGGLTGINFY